MTELPHLHEGDHAHGGPRMTIPEGGVILPGWMQDKLLPMLTPGSRPPMTDPAAALDELNTAINHTRMPTWQAAAIAFCEQHLGPLFMREGLWKPTEIAAYANVIRAMYLVLGLCRPYLWRHEALAMAKDVAGRLPPDTTWDRGMLHAPAMYWAREEDAIVADDPGRNLLRRAGLTRLLATVVVDRQHVYEREGHRVGAQMRAELARDKGGIVQFTLWATEAGVMFPLAAATDWGEVAHAESLPTMAQCLFLQSKLAALSGSVPHRAARHRWERNHPSIKAPVVDVVTLRQRERRADAGDGEGREYSYRWPVRAHPHKYHYKGPGGADEVRTRLVADYLKGPEGKPLRIPQRRGTVYNVGR